MYERPVLVLVRRFRLRIPTHTSTDIVSRRAITEVGTSKLLLKKENYHHNQQNHLKPNNIQSHKVKLCFVKNNKIILLTIYRITFYDSSYDIS